MYWPNVLMRDFTSMTDLTLKSFDGSSTLFTIAKKDNGNEFITLTHLQ